MIFMYNDFIWCCCELSFVVSDLL